MSRDGVQLVGHQCTARAVGIIEHVRIVEHAVFRRHYRLERGENRLCEHS